MVVDIPTQPFSYVATSMAKDMVSIFKITLTLK